MLHRLNKENVQMKKVFAAVLALCVVIAMSNTLLSASVARSAASKQPELQRCVSLIGSRFGPATIEDASLVDRGDSMLSWLQWAILTLSWSDKTVYSAPQEFCRVTAMLRPAAGSEITAEVWLPQPWNGKLLGAGGSGFNGGLFAAPSALREPLAKGYAGLVTNAGHNFAFSAKFSQYREQYIDYAYRANHVAAMFAKALISSYYGRPARRAYFHGCSNGGRDALMEARRFPEDYDGIIAGAPAAGWSRLMAADAWNVQAAARAPQLEDKLQLVQKSVIAKCDALDGINDGLLENPLSCQFDPAELRCLGAETSQCLTEDEVTALHNIYRGPHLRDGSKVYGGQPVGGEALPGNWDDWILDEDSGQALLARETFRWMVYGDSEWDIGRFDIDRDYAKAKLEVGPMMDSDDPDLNAFTRRGGKLMLYHGWNDAALPATATLDYFTALRDTLGSSLEGQVRLFMVPGMMHCSGGPGTTDFDALEHMDLWVERGLAPDRIVATAYDPPAESTPVPGATVARTRPLCAWPKQARYSGKGSVSEAESFVCE
jgi:hypothetical protein